MDSESEDFDQNSQDDFVVNNTNVRLKRGGVRDFFKILDEQHAHIIFGVSNQGKSYAMHNIIKKYLSDPNNTVLIIKNTVEDSEQDFYKFSKIHPSRLHFAKYVDMRDYFIYKEKDKDFIEEAILNEFLAALRIIINDKISSKIRYFRGKTKTSNVEKFLVVFDDILSFSPKNIKRLNNIIKELTVQGRHSDIKIFVMVQHYKSLEKISRSNCSSFSVMMPPEDEYIKLIWTEYFHSLKFNDFIEFTMGVPRYSILTKKKNTGEVFLIEPSDGREF